MSHGNISNQIKIDCVMSPTTLSSALYTDYVNMTNYDKVAFITECGSGLTCSGGVSHALYGAQTAAGGSAVVLGVYTTANGTPADALNVTRAKALVIDNASSFVSLTDTITINGIVFTANSSGGVTTGTFSTARYIRMLNDGSVAAATCQHLAAYINHASYGVPGVNASVNGNPITCSSANNVYLYSESGTITVAVVTTDVQLVPTRFDTVLECKSADLVATSSALKYVACLVTPSSATARTSVIAIRSGSRFSETSTGTMSDYDFEV